MYRKDCRFLKKWFQAKVRKPLIIRGARQIGKSTLVKMFAKDNQLDLIEINLEIETLKSVEAESFDIQNLLDEIQLKKRKIIGERSLLFFDEIQENPRLLKLLRYFYEFKPELAVVSAGSLLEIALKDQDFSFPVGRVEFYNMGPMDLEEFLLATGQDFLISKLKENKFDEVVHLEAIKALRNYLYIGGMPEVVQEYVNSSSLVRMREIQEQIIQAYIADFPKYNRRIDTTRISRVFAASALEVGKKVIYKRFDSESKSREVKRVIELLIDARVLLPTFHSDANTIPLEGEADLSVFKLYFLDVGLLNAILKLDIEAIDSNIKNNFNTKGVIAEQFVAQHLCFVNGHEKRPSLFYHLRDKGSQKAEIDFVIEKNGRILPIEVKATAVGHLKSLMQFMQSKDCEVGMKFSLSPFSEEFITLKNGQRKKLINVPLYAFLFYDYSKIK